MAELEIKDKSGKKVGKQKISDAIASAPVQPVSLHRAIVAEEANSRQGTQKAKTRAEVRGGGRKPYKQKKTGNARQGTIRAPHYAHGGMAFAVAPRDYEKKVNRKERRAAILGALSTQIEAGNVSLVDSIVFAEPRTKDALTMLEALGFKNQRRLLIILPTYDPVTLKSFRNLSNVVVKTAPSKEPGAKQEAFSARDVLVAHKVLIVADAMTRIEEVWGQ
ncbi:MAG: 50S ribosomal protein L4 [Fimbriimonas sp.]